MKKLYGVTTAMVTPITSDNKVDHGALADLTRMLVSKGVNCLYPCGTTGEMFRLSVAERKAVLETVVKASEGKVTVYSHCGAMNQEDTIELVRHAKDSGADGVGVVTPIFFIQNRRELEEYFVAVADSVPGFPVYLYSIPQLAMNDLPAEVAANIAKRCDNVIGIKYSYPDIILTTDYCNIKDGDFSVLQGCDRAMVGFMAAGCDGTVSGISGVFPEPFVAAYKAYAEGDLPKAQKLQKICVKFCDVLKRGANMSYYKEALKMRGINAGFMRKPQLDIEQAEILKLEAELETLCKESNISMKI
ncbi:MAG: dihydrodipicolinate synthase family protein [Defluviitaleaceae bacterium]|nr:dihydrodipicolinate synthase family protein [Defluviitaleaceae bacterium]